MLVFNRLTSDTLSARAPHGAPPENSTRNSGLVRVRKSAKMKSMAQEFGNRLRETRESRRATQQDLAALAGVDTMQISRYERGLGMPAAETVVALARALKVTTDYLLIGKKAESSHEKLPVEDLLLMEKFREAQSLTGPDRQALLLVIDSILVRRDEETRVDKRRRLAS